MTINTNFNNNVNLWSLMPANNRMASFANMHSWFNFGFAMGVNMANTPQSFRTSVLDLRRGADNLRASLNTMRSVADSPFRNWEVRSSDNNILQINQGTIPRTSAAGIVGRNNTVEVLQLATAQRNEGNALVSSALAADSGFTVGENRFSINMGTRQFDFNFTISETDTNRDVQQRIANAVNSRNIGVTAQVTTDSNAGTSMLVFASRETGVNVAGQPNFTVNDGMGGAIAILGGNQITTQAQDAQFRVNRGFTGALQTARTNDVSLGFGITATLRDVGRVTLDFTRDETSQIDSFRNMVGALNDFMAAARGAGGRLERDVMGLVQANSASLSRLGVTLSGGNLRIDEQRLQRAAEQGALDSFVNRDRPGLNFGFLNRLDHTAARVSRNPGSFIENVMPQTALMQNNMFNPRMINQMNRMLTVGMLFDSLF